ncbi:thioredoxin family protein [Roseateles sp. SL47]|uniref:thioredoxin family protein n=1 Tax=Roseateles sp. SL47 TaxID=2995138 RepID=UPI00226FD116|nr:thioredoxin fold domain-containing protein [Roseateles sp. SL47]WAC75711.1 thioredoxin family protein [Roseateles sp. SL47]
MKLIKPAPVIAAWAAAIVLLACPAAHAVAGAGVAWQAPAGDGDIDRFFAQAKAEKKPVLLYWGAKWCPPCNQLKATLFNRADFIEQSKAYIAVGIDGDAPGAQRLGTRFKVSGYPTLILFNPGGGEITRLPGEMDAVQVMSVLQLGISGGRTVGAIIADALAGKKLSANEWRLLSFHEWQSNEQLVPSTERAAVLARLAKASEGGDAQTTTRLWLKSISAMAPGSTAAPDQLPRLQAILKDPVQTLAQMGVLVERVPTFVQAFAPQKGERRASLIADFEVALTRLNKDETLSRADRLNALLSRVELARIDAARDEMRPAIPAPLLAEVREQVGRIDREVTNAYERQSIISGAAQVLARAGLWTESDDLLKAGLARSHSAYYLMSHLAGNAMKQGKKAEALRWYGEAFSKSEGTATRLQWGSAYLRALMSVSPDDAARIESTASQLLSDAAKDPGGFYGRSGASLKRVAGDLAKWNQGPKQAAVVDRLKRQLDSVCVKLSGDERAKAACEDLMTQQAIDKI